MAYEFVDGYGPVPIWAPEDSFVIKGRGRVFTGPAACFEGANEKALLGEGVIIHGCLYEIRGVERYRVRTNDGSINVGEFIGLMVDD